MKKIFALALGLLFLPLIAYGAAFPIAVGGTGTTSPAIGQLAWWAAGNLTGVSTTTASCSGNTSCTPFIVIGPSPITISSTGGSGGGNVSTSTHETAGGIAYWTSNSATPALLGEVATSSASCSGGASCSAFTVVGSTAPTINVFGYLFPSNATSTNLAFNGGLSTTYASTTQVSASTGFCIGSSCITSWATSASSTLLSDNNTWTGHNDYNAENYYGTNTTLQFGASSANGGQLYYDGTNFNINTTSLQQPLLIDASKVEIATNNSGEDTGVGATSPAAKLEILGNSGSNILRLDYSTSDYANFNVLSTGTLVLTTTNSTPFDITNGIFSEASSTIGNGLQAGGLTISGGATTTGNLVLQGSTTTATNGFNLSGGCFAIAGTCVGGSSLVGSTGQVAYFSGTNTAVGTSTLTISTVGHIVTGGNSPSCGTGCSVIKGDDNNFEFLPLGSQIATTSMSTSTGPMSFTPVAGTTELEIFMWGGGGGGGNSASSESGGGGGAGGYVAVSTTTISSSYHIIIGTGGTSNTGGTGYEPGGGGSGGGGGATSVANVGTTTLLIACGGGGGGDSATAGGGNAASGTSGGSGGTGGSNGGGGGGCGTAGSSKSGATGGSGGTGGTSVSATGGNGSSGSGSTGGAGGSSGGQSGNGNAGSSSTGGNGSGGASGGTTNNNGSAGSGANSGGGAGGSTGAGTTGGLPGAGGGGSGNDNNGGTGGAGAVVIVDIEEQTTAIEDFASAWAKSPACIPTSSSGVAQALGASSTVSTVTITASSGFSSNNWILVHCEQSANFTF